MAWTIQRGRQQDSQEKNFEFVEKRGLDAHLDPAWRDKLVRFDLLRLYTLAAFALVVGLVTAWLNLSDLLSGAFFFGFLGLSWLVSGLITLWSYLHRTRPIGMEEGIDQSGEDHRQRV